VPRLGDSFELMLAAIVKLDAGPGDEVMRGCGHEHLAGGSAARDACAEMDSDAARLASVRTLDLARVHAGSHAEAELAQHGTDLERSADRARRSVEEGEESVPGRIDLLAAKALELVPY
jgi:hypothetical protein